MPAVCGWTLTCVVLREYTTPMKVDHFEYGYIRHKGRVFGSDLKASNFSILVGAYSKHFCVHKSLCKRCQRFQRAFYVNLFLIQPILEFYLIPNPSFSFHTRTSPNRCLMIDQHIGLFLYLNLK